MGILLLVWVFKGLYLIATGLFRADDAHPLLAPIASIPIAWIVSLTMYFPLGMYAACSFALSQVTGITGFSAFARVWTWLAVAVSVFVFAGLIRRSWQVLSG